jgi:hydroxyacylglutathione hydrolase
MKSLYGVLLAFGLTLACAPATADPVPGSMDVHWNEGAADCSKAPQAPLQVHRYNAQTYILRESPCATFEAPFMYLLIGSRRALLIDTGDVADPKQMPLAKTVMDLLPGDTGAKMPLLVVHTHGHLDHRAGDPQFAPLRHVQVVPTDLGHVKQFFGFNDWPNGVSQIDLGDRTVDVLPTPGHYPSHVSYYDRNTALFFSGDFFMPGRLIIDDADSDLASARRVADFVKDRPVSYVLGGHIELNAQGDTFMFGSNYHPDEHALQLTKQDLMGLPAMVAKFNGFYTEDGMFVMFNQFRVLAAELAAMVLILVGIVAVVWRYMRRRKRARLARARTTAMPAPRGTL